jgi:hypothetical protein
MYNYEESVRICLGDSGIREKLSQDTQLQGCGSKLASPVDETELVYSFCKPSLLMVKNYIAVANHMIRIREVLHKITAVH